MPCGFPRRHARDDRRTNPRPGLPVSVQKDGQGVRGMWATDSAGAGLPAPASGPPTRLLLDSSREEEMSRERMPEGSGEAASGQRLTARERQVKQYSCADNEEIIPFDRSLVFPDDWAARPTPLSDFLLRLNEATEYEYMGVPPVIVVRRGE